MANGDDRGPNVVILTSVFTSLSVVATGLRLSVRKYHHQLGWDDLAIAIAVLATIVSWPLTILAVKDGYGRHVDELSDSQSQDVLKWLWAIEFNLFFTLPLTKISICCFIRRIKNTGWLKWFLYAMITGLALTNLVPIIVLCAQCQPLFAYWDRAAGSCWDASIYNIAIWIGVSYGIFSDFVCTCLPIVVLWNVNIKRRMKYLISALMGLGLLATSCGAVRAYVSAQNNSSTDLTYALAIITEWAVLEQHFAILGTNFALARYIWLSIRPRKKSTNQDYSGGMIPLSRRRKYTSISHAARRAPTSSDSIAALENGIIRATTEIDVRRESRPQSPVNFLAIE